MPAAAFALIVIASASQPVLPAPPAPPVLITAPPATVESEVLANIRQQRVGSVTLESFNLPDDFLRRVADRVIRTSYLDQFQVVLDDTQRAAPGAAPAGPSSASGPARGSVPWAAIVGAAIALGVLVVALRALLRRGAPE